MRRRLTLHVASEHLLDRIATHPRALGLPAAKTTFEVLREMYFDAPDGTLRDRRMTLRLSMKTSGLQVLELSIRSAVNLQGVVEEELLTAPLGQGQGLYEGLRGSSELATRVREVVDPVALRSMLALDIDRPRDHSHGGLDRKRPPRDPARALRRRPRRVGYAGAREQGTTGKGRPRGKSGFHRRAGGPARPPRRRPGIGAKRRGHDPAHVLGDGRGGGGPGRAGHAGRRP